MGAYRIPLETGLLIPSVKSPYRNVGFAGFPVSGDAVSYDLVQWVCVRNPCHVGIVNLKTFAPQGGQLSGRASIFPNAIPLAIVESGIMPLSHARKGESIGFSIYPETSVEFTLGNPEAIIWSSIRHLCSQRAGEWYAHNIHKIHNKRTRSAVAKNVKLYVQQASEFYDAAVNAKPNTAPLFYYYSFLNLAKALCEIRYPRLHRRRECYAHGLFWRPDPLELVNIAKDKVTIGRRGIWHLLWEVLMEAACPARDPTPLSVLKLFSYCPEIGVEFEKLYGEAQSRVWLDNIDAIYDEPAQEVWLKFSIARGRIRDSHFSATALMAQMSTARSTYAEVKSEKKELRTFQSATPARLRGRTTPYSVLRNDILGLNLITLPGQGPHVEYSFPLQTRLPLRMPQLMVTYTLLFWLGSLVRYDPHSVYELIDSPDWILIDGFMTQSRPWLLELFQWALFKKQTILRAAR